VNFKTRLQQGLAMVSRLCPMPDEATLARLVQHEALIARWNRTHNLTSLTAMDAIVESLFIDAWLVLGLWPEVARGVVDVGAGAGFPGLVILSAHPELPAVIFEKVDKKRAFLATACATLGLASARVASEPFPPKTTPLAPSPTVFLSRATWAPREWLDIWRSVARPGDFVVLQSGKEKLPAGAEREIEATLPFSGAQRHLALFRK
jgi:16S rRNA (guanine527-N7)-methyltransferase